MLSVFETYRNDLYAHMKSKDVTDFVFRVVKIPKAPICLSDVLIREDDLYTAYQNGKQEMFCPIFVHALPYEAESVLIFGYDKRHCNERVVSDIEQWISCEEKGKVIVDLMVRANNWCVAPSFLGERPEEVCEEILARKMECAFGV